MALGHPPRVVLIGMMGAGKSTIGRLLGERLGWPYLDNDAEVQRSTGHTIPEIWHGQGEAAYRVEEARVLAEATASSGPAVISCGGGTVLDPANRDRIGHAGLVVWLRAGVATLAARVGTGEGRPLLDNDPATSLHRLAAERTAIYEELAEMTVDTDQGTPDEVTDRIVARLRGALPGRGAVDRLRKVTVNLGSRSYPVWVGAGAKHLLAEVVPAGAQRAAIVTQAGIGVEVNAGLPLHTFFLGGGEAAKTMSSVEALCRGFAGMGLTRADVVVAVGGGVVTDIAGFAAAVYHRGVDVIHVPTTLLGQVDAAIGGKTGVNLAEGKNLVGAFWQPAAVLCDIDTLASLPEREYRSGLGEMAKYAFLGVDGLAKLPIEDAVAACVACKAEVVGADEREGDRRALLNYGHTLAHALETVGQYDLRHGEAVAIGLIFAARLARRLGRIDDARVQQHYDVVSAYHLPDRLPAGSTPELLVEVMGRDKKALTGRLTFVLDGPRHLELVDGVDQGAVIATLGEMGG